MWNTKAKLKHRRTIDKTLFDQLVCKHDMAGFEHFDLRLYAKLANTLRHDAQMRGCIDENGFTEIEGAHVERADIGPQFLDMMQALKRLHQRRPGTPDGGIILTRGEARTFTGGEVD